MNNSIVFGNEAPTVPAGNNVFGAFTNNNSLVGVDPSFAAPLDASDTAPTTGGDYRLGNLSVAIDAGNNSLVPSGITVDLDGNPRRVNDPGVSDTGVGTAPIVDIDAFEKQTSTAPPPTLSINDVTVNEGNAGITNFTFTVSLSAPAGPGGVTFNIATANGTATAGLDYVAQSLTGQTIPAGSSTYIFTVLVNGDTLNEANETFFVNVTSVIGANVADAQGVGTITNDDPLPSLSISDVTVVEGNSGTVNAVFAVSLSAASGQNVAVGYSTGDGTAAQPADYSQTTGTLTFAAGTTSLTVAVPVVGDIVPEANETFFVNLSGAVNATISDNQGVGTIANDDAPVVVNPATVNNGTVGVSYNQLLTGSGGVGAYSFAVTGGALPGGLTLAPNGAITGTPNAAGPFNFTVTATDSSPAPGPFTGSRAYTVNIAQGTQTVTFAPASPVVFGAAPITLTATATSGLTTFTFSTSSANTICTVLGNQLTITGAGVCNLTAAQPGNANYLSAFTNASVTINPASQTVTFAPASPVSVGAAAITLTATASSGLTAFTFSTTSANTICTVVGNQLTIVGVGICALTATQAGNANYLSGSATASVVINQGTQTLTFAPSSPVSFGATPITLTATATSGLTAFTFSTTSANTICTVAGNQLTIVGVGTCALTATQPGDANYASASASANVVINVVAPGAPTGLSAAAGNAQATISFKPPLFEGCAPIKSYSVSCTPSAAAPTMGGDSLIIVTGLSNGITYNCTVVATNSAGDSVASSPVQVTPTFRSYVAPAATGTGTISASFTGGGDTCNFGVARYITLEGHAASPPAGSAPAGISFPHGLFDFTTTGCAPGATIAMTIVYPQPLPVGTQYWKYGPTPTNATPNWYVLPATVSGNSVTFSITDGQLGDDDLQANGTIVDQGGPGVPPAQPVPIAGPWYWALLLFMAIVGLGRYRVSRLRILWLSLFSCNFESPKSVARLSSNGSALRFEPNDRMIRLSGEPLLCCREMRTKYVCSNSQRNSSRGFK